MTTTPRPPSMKTRPLYSQRFLAEHGRGLQEDEIRLVQGYRGLSPHQREDLLMRVSVLVIDNARRAVRP